MNQKTSQPLISIVLPVRNAENYLASCINSLLNQSYGHFEIIAIDDNSSDKSFTILHKFKKLDKRIKVWRNVKRYGSVVTLNRAIKKAHGDLIAFMKAEDISHKDRLKKQLNFLQENKKIVAVGSQCKFIDSKDQIIGTSEFPTNPDTIYKKPIHAISIQFESLMVHRMRIPKDIIKFHTNRFPYIYSDIFVKLLQYGRLGNLTDLLYIHREIPHEQMRTPKRIWTSIFKQWLRAETLFGYRPSFKSYLSPLLPRLKTT